MKIINQIKNISKFIVVAVTMALPCAGSAIVPMGVQDMKSINGMACPCKKNKTGSVCSDNKLKYGCTTVYGGPICDPNAGSGVGAYCRSKLAGYPMKDDECGSTEPGPSSCTLDPKGDDCIKYQIGNCNQNYKKTDGTVGWVPSSCSCDITDGTIYGDGFRTTAKGDDCPATK